MHRSVIFAAAVVLIVTAAVFLFHVDPESSAWGSWIPKCPIYHLTGYECPGCGSQRALYHLLHLDFRTAWSHNPFLFIATPYAAALVGVTAAPDEKLSGLRRICHNATTIYLFLGGVVVWWIVRNL